jgi:hypothetical protein
LKSLGQKRLQLGVPNLPALMAESNAEEWCSAVDIGGKEDFIKFRAKREIPAQILKTPVRIFQRIKRRHTCVKMASDSVLVYRGRNYGAANQLLGRWPCVLLGAIVTRFIAH